MFCEKCGKQIEDIAKFCDICGAKQEPKLPPESSFKPQNLHPVQIPTQMPANNYAIPKKKSGCLKWVLIVVGGFVSLFIIIFIICVIIAIGEDTPVATNTGKSISSKAITSNESVESVESGVSKESSSIAPPVAVSSETELENSNPFYGEWIDYNNKNTIIFNDKTYNGMHYETNLQHDESMNIKTTEENATVIHNLTLSDNGAKMVVLSGLEASEYAITEVYYKNNAKGKAAYQYHLDEQEYISSCSYYSYDEIARNPDKYEGKRGAFTGKVVQVIESEDYLELRVNITEDELGFWGDTIYVTFTPEDIKSNRILEDDLIEFYGEINGLLTYTSTLDVEITLPIVTAEYIWINK